MAVLDVVVAALLASAALASPVLNERATTTSTSATNTNPTTTLVATATGKSGLNDAAKAAGKLWFGTAADIPGPETSDKYYMKEFNNAHDFGEATPANIMKVSLIPYLIFINGFGANISSHSSCTPNQNKTFTTSLEATRLSASPNPAAS
jgi:hypothetical protein